MGQFKVGKTLFPEQRRLSKEFRGLLKQNIFAGFRLVLQTRFMQMRLVLKDGDQSLPFMVWSAGQRVRAATARPLLVDATVEHWSSGGNQVGCARRA